MKTYRASMRLCLIAMANVQIMSVQRSFGCEEGQQPSSFQIAEYAKKIVTYENWDKVVEASFGKPLLATERSNLLVARVINEKQYKALEIGIRKYPGRVNTATYE